MFMLSDLNQMFTKVININITDEAAESMIDDAILQAAIEIRNYARQNRETEKNLMAYRKECDDRREVIARGNRERHAREARESTERNKMEHAATGR